MQEIWKDVANYEGLYQVSNLGRVKSIGYKKELILKHFNTGGYKRVTLIKNKIRKHHLIHRLVAETFIPNLNNLPQINHKDENKKNNCVNNLEWCSNSYNIQYSKAKSVLQFDLENNLIKEYSSITEARKETKQTHIGDCCSGKRKTNGGYIWKYKDAI